VRKIYNILTFSYNMSLVDRLDGVHMGDMLHLVSEFFWTGGSGEGHVVGYVVNYTSEEVTLSHQGPVTPENIRHHITWKKISGQKDISYGQVTELTVWMILVDMKFLILKKTLCNLNLQLKRPQY